MKKTIVIYIIVVSDITQPTQRPIGIYLDVNLLTESKKNMKKIYLFMLAIIPGFLSAHPGHDYFDGITLVHYMSSPIHLLPLLTIIILIFTFMLKRRLSRNKRQTELVCTKCQ